MPRLDAARRLAVAVPLLLLGALACGPRLTPEEKIELVRSQYSAELKSLTVEQDPIASASLASAAVPAVRSDAILDIVLTVAGERYLPGLTIDLRHVDAAKRDKDRHTVWVDTSGLTSGGTTAVKHVLENVEWETGDGFLVEVRTPVPAQERAAYREFRAD